MTWKHLREAAFLVIGLALVILLTSVRAEQEAGQERGLNTRVVACWTNKALRQPTDGPDPCQAKDVQEILGELTIVPIGTGADHHKTQTILCQFMERTELGAPEECGDVISDE